MKLTVHETFCDTILSANTMQCNFITTVNEERPYQMLRWSPVRSRIPNLLLMLPEYLRSPMTAYLIQKFCMKHSGWVNRDSEYAAQITAS